MYICVYVCVYVCVYICVYVCVCMYIMYNVCVNVHMCHDASTDSTHIPHRAWHNKSSPFKLWKMVFLKVLRRFLCV